MKQRARPCSSRINLMLTEGLSWGGTRRAYGRGHSANENGHTPGPNKANEQANSTTNRQPEEVERAVDDMYLG